MSRDEALLARQRAVALRYSAGDGAPVVTAKGAGVTAQTIVELAREHGVFVHESPELVGLLMRVDLDEQIPPALYAVIAELLAWLYSLECRLAPEAEQPASEH